MSQDRSAEPQTQHPWRSKILVGLAWAAVIGGTLVLGLYRSWTAEKPTPTRGHWEAVARGRAFLSQNRPDLALQAVADVRDEAPGAGEAMCVAGIALGKMDQFRAARLALERAIMLQPRQPMATKVLAALHLSMGDSQRGLECLKKAAELAPTDFRPWFAMGQVYLDLGEPADAASSYEQALKRNPADIKSRIGRAEALLAANQNELAGRLIADALPLAPSDPKLLGLAARQARDAGRNEEALAFADRALAADRDNVDALLTRARLKAAANQPSAARADLEHVVTINPNQIAALTLLAQVESQLNLPDAAAKTALRRKQASDRLVMMDGLTREISARPDDPEPRYLMGLTAIQGNQTTLALNCFNAALALDPQHAGARQQLARLAPKAPTTAKSGSPFGTLELETK